MSLVAFVQLLSNSCAGISKSLPRSPFEPPQIEHRRLPVADPELHSPLGGILTPATPKASSIAPFNLPTRARYGKDFSFDLAIAEDAGTPENTAIQLAALAEHIVVEAVYQHEDPIRWSYIASAPLEFVCTSHPALRCVRVSVSVPDDDRLQPASAQAHSSLPPIVSLRWVSVGGERLCPSASSECRDVGAEDDDSVLHVPVGCGINTPQALTFGGPEEFNTLTTPAISQDGTLYLALHFCESVFVYAFDGMRLPSLDCAGVGISQYASVAAFHDETGTLFVADWINAPHTRLVAIDAATGRRRWRSQEEELDRCRGLAVLDSFGLVAASSHETYRILLFSIGDGSFVAEHKFDVSTFGRVECLAAVPGTPTLFASVGGEVRRLEWNGVSLDCLERVEAAGSGNTTNRPLAVVPPWSRGAPAHLVVAREGEPELLVLSLPDCALVHTHILQTGRVKGLAADPAGAALAVCCNSSVGGKGEVVVLQWPLSDMPAEKGGRRRPCQ
jgi:hypothetical protein